MYIHHYIFHSLGMYVIYVCTSHTYFEGCIYEVDNILQDHGLGDGKHVFGTPFPTILVNIMKFVVAPGFPQRSLSRPEVLFAVFL